MVIISCGFMHSGGDSLRDVSRERGGVNWSSKLRFVNLIRGEIGEEVCSCWSFWTLLEIGVAQGAGRGVAIVIVSAVLSSWCCW